MGLDGVFEVPGRDLWGDSAVEGGSLSIRVFDLLGSDIWINAQYKIHKVNPKITVKKNIKRYEYYEYNNIKRISSTYI